MDTTPRHRTLSLLALLTACALGQDADEVGSLTSPLPAYDAFGATASVGTLPGELTVDFDGVAHYSIPIEVPPARAGHQPSLAFSYASSDAVGLLGRGWSLSGLSAITRCAKTFATDGERRAVAYDAQDAFCLDGARLLPAGDGPSDEYRTEEESLIRAFASGGSGGVLGPSAWEVLRPDGSTWIYGQSEDSRATPSTEHVHASWHLTSVQDPFGNEIRYRYASEVDAPRPARGALPTLRPVEILYGGHVSGLPPTHAIRFLYEERPDPMRGFSGGYHWRVSQRLVTIEVYPSNGSGAPLRTYHLEYANGATGAAGATGASRVVGIRDCVDAPAAPGADVREGRVCRPATNFEWEVGEPTIRTDSQAGEWTNRIPTGEQSLANGLAVNRWGTQVVLDANGDGKSDIAYVTDGNLLLLVGGDTLGAPVETSVTDLWAIDHNLYPYDVDGDGRDDLVFIAAEDVVPGVGPDEATLGSRGTARVMIAYSRGLDFVVVPTSATYPYSDLPLQDIPGERSYLTGVAPNPVFTSSNSYVADFDGDGQPDVLSCETLSDENPDHLCGRVRDNGYNMNLQPPVDATSACRGEWTIRSDIRASVDRHHLGYNSFCTNQRSPYSGAVIGDFTGDGIPDLFYMDREISHHEMGERPVGFSASMLERDEFDSIDDVPASAYEWKVLTFDLRWAESGAAILSTGIPFIEQMGPVVADVDGDGISDIITYEDASPGVISTRFSFNNGESPELVRNVWLSTGGELGVGGGFAHDSAIRFVRVGHEAWTPNAQLRQLGDPLLRRYMACQNVQTCGRMWKWISMRRDLAIDLNGDGRHDLISAAMSDNSAFEPDFDSGADAFYWSDAALYNSLSNGSAFDLISVRGGRMPSPVSRIVSGGGMALSEFSSNHTATLVLDFDGDGAADVFYGRMVHDADVLEGYRPATRIEMTRSSRPERIDQIINGLGETTRVTYRPLSDPAVYHPSIDCDAEPNQRCVTGTRKVVATVERDSGGIEPRRTHYQYWDGRVDLRGRGFLGFRKVSHHDEATRRVSTYQFDRALDPDLHAYYLNRRPVWVTHLWQSENLQYEGESSRTLGVQIVTLYEHVRYDGERWRTVPLSTTVQKYEDAQYLGLDGTADLVFTGRIPVSSHEIMHSYVADPTAPWWSRHLPRQTTSTMFGASADGVSETLDLTYVPPSDSVWQVGRIATEITQTNNDLCDTYTALRHEYHPLYGARRMTTRQPDDLAPPRSSEQREREVQSEELVYSPYGTVTGISISDLTGRTRSIGLDHGPNGERPFPNSISNSLGHRTTLHFHPALGVPWATVDPNGYVSATQFDGFGRPVRSEHESGAAVVLHYEVGPPGVSFRVRAVSNDGAEHITNYDRLGRNRSSEWREVRNGSLAWVRQARGFDRAGRVISEGSPYFVSDGPGGGTDFVYDDLGTLRSVLQPTGEVHRHRRLPGRRLSLAPLGRERELVLDSRGRVVSSGEVGGTDQLTHRYCADGRLISTVDPQGNATEISYDLLGRRETLNDPDRGLDLFVYDAFDELVETFDAARRAVFMQYDSLGRLVERRDDSGLTEWFYDPASAIGELAGTTSPDGVETEYQYGRAGLLEEETFRVDGLDVKLEYSHDELGRVTGLDYHGGFRTRYEYGAGGHLSGVYDDARNRLIWAPTSFTALGALEREEFGNGTTAARDYRPESFRVRQQQVRNARGQVLQNWRYEYRRDGRLRSRVNHLDGNHKEGYGYDTQGRLTSVTSTQEGHLSFDYDALGNLTHASDVGELRYESPSPHRVSHFRGVLQQYDDVGNHLGDAVRRRVEYNALDLPRMVRRHSDGAIQQSRYDAFGNRSVVHEPDMTRYTFGPFERVGTTADVYRVEVGGRVVAQAVRRHGYGGVTISYLHDDRLGSLDLVTGQNGQVLERYAYDAFGGRKARPGAPLPNTPNIRPGYTGHTHDDGWGTIHMRGRAYDPEMRRMTGVDPVVVDPWNLQAFNRYSYVLNDPMNLVDPTGFVPSTPPVPEPITYNYDQDVVIGERTPDTTPSPPVVPDPPAPPVGPDHTPGPSPVSQHLTHDRAVEIGAQQISSLLGRYEAQIDPGASFGPGVGAGEQVLVSMARSTFDDIATAHSSTASTGDRLMAGGRIALTAFGGVAVNALTQRARAIGALANTRFAGRLTFLGNGRWRSTAGLIYGRGSVHGNRVRHVLAHATPDPSKPTHSVFNVARNRVLRLVDEAWAARGSPTVHPSSGNWNYRVDMGRVIGTGGQRSINISVRPGTSEIITAFPVL